MGNLKDFIARKIANSVDAYEEKHTTSHDDGVSVTDYTTPSGTALLAGIYAAKSAGVSPEDVAAARHQNRS
ncbi:hypothetical protein [Streptomyces sp. NPDC048644]|uniref:hypothetical protein n=1 Tax=Streptomyces sp. NPDC048644 TaxID=3365582 RepID=UPI00371CC01F